MIKVEAIKEFTLERFDELEDIVRYNPNLNEKNKLHLKDTFKCKKELADYLMGNNLKGETVVKVVEVVPKEEKVETLEAKIVDADKIEVRVIDESTGTIYEKEEEKPKKRKTTRKRKKVEE